MVSEQRPAAVPSPLPAPLKAEFFARDARSLAPDLVGKLLVRGDGRLARVVEVEAYGGPDDPASHAFRGRTPRAAIMFGPPGRLYVYFSYGMHWCANVVCSAEGTASAVLLRAAQPLDGLEMMRAARSPAHTDGSRRRPVPDLDLCRGPGRLCQAFGVTGAMNGVTLVPASDGLWLADDGAGPAGPLLAAPRVGVSRAAEVPLRFVVGGSRWVSSPRVPVR